MIENQKKKMYNKRSGDEARATVLQLAGKKQRNSSKATCFGNCFVFLIVRHHRILHAVRQAGENFMCMLQLQMFILIHMQ